MKGDGKLGEMLVITGIVLGTVVLTGGGGGMYWVVVVVIRIGVVVGL